MKKKQKYKRYIVSFDMRWSHDIEVSAPTRWKARTKAFVRFLRRLCLKDFRIDIEEKRTD